MTAHACEDCGAEKAGLATYYYRGQWVDRYVCDKHHRERIERLLREIEAERRV